MSEKNTWQKEGHKVIVIVPAYNEAVNIGEVVQRLKIIQAGGAIQGVIVVSDGSKDATARIARREGAEVIEYKRNFGKSRAVIAGAKKAKADGATIIVTLDADMKNITGRRVWQLIEPLVKMKNLNMTIGRAAQTPPEYSGERAIRVSAIGGLFKGTKTWKTIAKSRYGLERYLNHLLKNSLRVTTDFEATRGARLGLIGMYDTGRYILSREKAAKLLRAKNTEYKKLRGKRRQAMAREIQEIREKARTARTEMLKHIPRKNKALKRKRKPR